MSVLVEKAIAVGLLTAIVFTALALGAVESWSLALFELIIVGLLALWAIKVVIDRGVTIRFPQLGLPLFALLGLGLIQSVAVASADGRRVGLSFDTEATRGAVTVLFFLLASFMIAANFFSRRERLRTMANFLAVYGLALAMFALIQYFTWNGNFYWIRPNTSGGSPFGPFVNHNNFAGHMELLIPIPVALIATRAVRSELKLFYAFSAAVMGLALVTSLSRGGMIALAAQMIFIAVWSSTTPRRAAGHGTASPKPRFSYLKKTGAVSAISLAILAGIIWIGPDQIVGRIANSNEKGETFYASRGWIWKDTLSMFAANPVTGVGLGAYETAYPIYSRSDGTLRVEFAHNDYLQILADGGVIGGVIAVVFIVVFARTFSRGLRAQEPLVRGIALGSGAGIFALLVHSAMDFNLQIPSNALLFLFLSAAAASAASLAENPEHRSLATRRVGEEISARATA
jgi:O-antigen ligase